MIDAIGTLASFVINEWTMVSLFMSWGILKRYQQAFHFIWAELKPFYLPAVTIELAITVARGEMLSDWLTPFNFFCAYLCWFLFKDIDDDDRWKRRKKKLVEKISRQGARLVVVPATN